MATPKRAPVDDTWLHHILPGKAISESAPRVKVRYLQNQIDLIENQVLPWEDELSGRALSLCQNIVVFATEKANSLGGPPGFRLRGVAHAAVRDIRSQGFDVYDDPTQGDSAHAVLTISKVQYAPNDGSGPPKISQDLVRKIAMLLDLAEDGEVGKLEAQCGSRLAKSVSDSQK